MRNVITPGTGEHGTVWWKTECRNTKSRTTKLGIIDPEHQIWNGKIWSTIFRHQFTEPYYQPK